MMGRIDKHAIRISVKDALDIMKEADFSTIPDMSVSLYESLVVATFSATLAAILQGRKTRFG